MRFWVAWLTVMVSLFYTSFSLLWFVIRGVLR
jgi:hypothetical protein